MRRVERGEVWLVDLGYAAKVRPVLVLSIPVHDSDRALVTVIPHTTSTRGSRFEVAIPSNFLATGAFDTQNPVTVSLAKFVRRLGVLSDDQLLPVEESLRFWLGL